MSTFTDDGRLDALSQCESNIGYVFKDRALLQSALTHASGASTRLSSNERLEFLGDAILGMVVCEMLFHEYTAVSYTHLTLPTICSV